MPEYECIKCDFYTKNKSDFNRHLLSKKHVTIFANDENNETDINKNMTSNICIYCNKAFQHSKNLDKHVCFLKKQNDLDNEYKNTIKQLTDEL